MRIKFCSNCNEGFSKRFEYCPNCANKLGLFEMEPVGDSLDLLPTTPEPKPKKIVEQDSQSTHENLRVNNLDSRETENKSVERKNPVQTIKEQREMKVSQTPSMKQLLDERLGVEPDIRVSDSYLKGWKGFIEFNGRSSRHEFWSFMIINGLIFMVLSQFTTETLAGIFSLICIIPIFSVTTRRLHDTGKTGLYSILLLILGLGTLVLLIFVLQKGDIGENQYGADPYELD